MESIHFTAIFPSVYMQVLYFMQGAATGSIETPQADFWVIVAVVSTVVGYCAKIYFT